EAGEDPAGRSQVGRGGALARRGGCAVPQLVEEVDQRFLGHLRVVEPVDLDHGGLFAGAKAFFFVEGDGAVGGDVFGGRAEVVVGSLVEALGAHQGAAHVGADGDDVAAGGAHAEHGVEGGDGLDLGGPETKEVADLPERLAGEVALGGLHE